MAIWDMLSTTPKDKTRRRSERSVTPLPMPADTDEPTSAAIVASELYPKLEGPHTPTPGLSKRKNENGSNGDEGSKRLRSGTVVQKLKATDTPDFSHSQSPPHSQRTRLSMSLMRPPSLRNFKMDDELDNAAIEKAMHQRTVAESAELKARNDLHLARVALNDRMGQKDDADSALAKQDEDIASLLQRVEEARKERDSLHQRVIHAASHLQDAEDRVEECGRDVVTKTASSKQAQRDYAVHVRGE